MKEITIKLYSIDELKDINKKAYDKILEDTKQFLIEDRFYFASEDIVNILKDKYNLSVNEENIYYSISYCQGDGMSFTLDNILSYTRIKNKKDMNIFERWITDNLSDGDMLLLLEYLNSGYNLNIIKTSYHYEHAHTCKIDYEYFYSSDDQKYLDIMDNFIYKLCEKLFNEVFLEICKYIEGVLYDYYDIDDEECIQYLSDNECFYDINGNQY